MNSTAGLVGVLLIGAVALVGWLAYTERVDLWPNGSNGADGTSQWEEFESASFAGGWQLNLEHPQEVEVSHPNENTYTFKYVGPESEPNTEITDGYLLTLVGLRSSGTLDAYAAQTRNRITDIETLVFNGHDARRYTVQTELGTEVEHTVFAAEDAEGGMLLVDLSVGVYGSQAEEYRETIENMFDTLTFSYGAPENAGAPLVSEVQIALLDYPASGNLYTQESAGPVRGCDRLVLVARSIPQTTMPLTAALTELFSIESEEVAGWQNFLTKTNDTLMFERAAVENGTAHVYLTGRLSGLAGVCDDPRAKIQIEETALQFPTVERVQLYLNGEPTNLQPSGSGL